MSAKTLAEHIRPLKLRTGSRTVRWQPGRALAASALREAVWAEIEPYLATLREAIPELAAWRRLYDHAWVLGLSADLPAGSFHGRPYSAFSRLEFALRVDVDTHEVELVASSTVYDRDLPTETFVGTASAPGSRAAREAATAASTALGATAPSQHGIDGLETFLEHQALLFATRFFQAAPRERWRVAGLDRSSGAGAPPAPPAP